ncbi:MFS transporter [Rufibacter glacialis]|uniref:MFS transporter n=1 Tax=Rufibacter glacialis TaxID=1259555 RepID=A0A5M8QPN2_9BACT|nr:MFS transporter [Rufibacter glacialis]KAA6438177.1 MFS transporter [Rufibacter glacialis]GGK89252.1 multidrug efflux MFS transporter NorB [Rufibacter glacialis]
MKAAQYQGTDKLLFGIILGVLAFWLFAQTILNINVVMAKDLQMETATMSIAVSITALFSGIFTVVMGGLADSLGRMKIIKIGFVFSIIGSLLVGITPAGAMAAPVLITGRILQGLSGACIMPASLAMLKAYWEGAARQRAISFWSMGTWGGSGFCSLFGGLMAGNVGWRYIFFASALVSLIGMWMVRGTPESKAPPSGGKKKRDVAGIVTFMVVMIALQVLVTQGSNLGWTSAVSLLLLATVIVSGIAFFRIEKGKESAFIDFKLFKNATYTGATISNFLLNGVAGMLIVSLMLLQVGGGLSAQTAGLLTLGYAISIVAFIRIGEKLLQRFGPRKPMLWGCIIVGVSISLLLPTNVMTDTYKILAVIAYTLFGVGLAFYATPSTDAALSNLPEAQTGAGSGIYKMASFLGAAFGVAISAGIFVGLSSIDTPSSILDKVISFSGRQDNIAIRQAAMIALLFNLFLVIVAIISIMKTIPKQEEELQRST